MGQMRCWCCGCWRRWGGSRLVRKLLPGPPLRATARAHPASHRHPRPYPGTKPHPSGQPPDRWQKLASTCHGVNAAPLAIIGIVDVLVDLVAFLLVNFWGVAAWQSLIKDLLHGEQHM